MDCLGLKTFGCVCRPGSAFLFVQSFLVWLAALTLPGTLLKGKARPKSHNFSPTLSITEVRGRLQSHTHTYLTKTHTPWTGASIRVEASPETQFQFETFFSSCVYAENKAHKCTRATSHEEGERLPVQQMIFLRSSLYKETLKSKCLPSASPMVLLMLVRHFERF